MNSLLNQTPPDDTGTDTLKRFRYQAQLALPFCLECARQDQATSAIEQLESRLEELDTVIELANNRVSEFERYVSFLDKTYQMILQEIRVPSLPDPGLSIVDRKTYLPRFEGRRFDELESQGLKVMVNIAHALAHQLTCIHFELKLPNILLIDGLSGNIGYEGLDRERIEAIYAYIIRISQEHRNRLQIIVSDNTVPESAPAYVFAEFDDERTYPSINKSLLEKLSCAGKITIASPMKN
jgi:hypothetical protein